MQYPKHHCVAGYLLIFNIAVIIIKLLEAYPNYRFKHKWVSEIHKACKIFQVLRFLAIKYFMTNVHVARITCQLSCPLIFRLCDNVPDTREQTFCRCCMKPSSTVTTKLAVNPNLGLYYDTHSIIYLNKQIEYFSMCNT